jgi:hypothetical protein
METFIKNKDRAIGGADHESLSPRFCAREISLWLLLLTATILLSACGGGGTSGGGPPINLLLSGDWQFTMAPPADGSFFGGPQGGFLLQNGGSVTGAATYAVSLSELLIPCNTGSAPITGTISSQTVNLTAVAGTQTFTLNGTLSLDGMTMAGTYMSTNGTAGDGAPCGTAQTGLQWSAILVPPITGTIQGTFHSAGGTAGLVEQEFTVSGALNQAANTGTSSAAVTGNLDFLIPLTNLSGYPCLISASLNGQISGNSVTLQIIGGDGSELGFIGEPINSLGSTGVNPVTFDSVNGGYILHGAGPSYLVATTACPGSLANIAVAGDFGNICLGSNGASACQQPITLTPSALIFPVQVVSSPPTMQTITLANASGTNVGGVTLNLTNTSGAANYTETDVCGVNGVPSQGQPFNLIPGQSCDVTVTFAPLETCAVGTPPDQCPSPLTATLVVTSPNSEMIFTVPITGTASSPGGVATREPDSSPEGISGTSSPRLLSFVNHNGHQSQIRPSASNRIFPDVEQHAEID